MKKRIGILTSDNVLYNKLRLLLRNECRIERLSEVDETQMYDMVFTDIDSFPSISEKTVTFSRTSECDIKIPFLHADVLKVINSSGDTAEEQIILGANGRSVSLYGETIKLTDLEYKLLKTLLNSSAEFVSREALLSTVWGAGFDPGVVNVYVHYLRSKLEKSGRKIILSSRKEGYGIDKKYRRQK